VLVAYKDFSAPLRELFRYYQTMEDSRVRYEELRRFLAGDTERPPETTILDRVSTPAGVVEVPRRAIAGRRAGSYGGR
jgi:hypothetical protein